MRVKNMTISRKNTFRESLNIYETNFKHFQFKNLTKLPIPKKVKI